MDSKKIITPYDDLTYKIIKVAMAVHNELGPGFTEQIYHRAMGVGLTNEQVQIETEFPIEITFREQNVGQYKLDLVAEKLVVIELKAVDQLLKTQY